jgi:hypothetical protein
MACVKGICFSEAFIENPLFEERLRPILAKPERD